MFPHLQLAWAVLLDSLGRCLEWRRFVLRFAIDLVRRRVAWFLPRLSVEQLRSMTYRPDVLESLVGRLESQYSVGVAQDDEGGACFLVRTTEDLGSVPSEVYVAGRFVPVVARKMTLIVPFRS